MSTQISVDLQAATPPYEQIRSQIASLISLGDLPSGSKLPTVRALATDLGVAAGTVARAYKELEAEELITSRRRAGTVVNERPQPVDTSEDLLAAVDHLWALAAAQKVDAATLKALVARRERK
ncbi:DNA-binding transcriptional regulator YhcF (GntR family) [Arthrobacter sp. JUb119]|uniref:GntR family transcriptional regulator n=1 Tax=Actinomycetes TaxID=1760 RepID=UPI000CFBFD6C|nr:MULTISPECIES: GntR family transcriptional regulator [unclassified Arthrobacter]MCS3493950.1 DNA-binding transcriptional regulator YhcF (GntR family) [Arthrobacter sp. JUb119]PQZ85345.1 GntR family transcriptional regulator [Arthrobacter sp. MYb222]PRB75069.1 GntR family transcriptional regulator [Arthrobacter sp. MYb214]TDU26966.1 GntR family transcriptional regulator [Arthrobacter sp. JUb115]